MTDEIAIAMQAFEKRAAEFVAGGGDEALYWAGKMSNAVNAVVISSATSLSGSIEWLDKMREKYDAVIISRCK